MKKQVLPVAVAVHIQDDGERDNSEEFLNLIRSAGYDVHPKIFRQRNHFSSKTLLSPGNIQELSLFLEEEKNQNVAVIVVSRELSPRQALNLEEALDLPQESVIDKFALILEVFEAHSTTEESRLRCQLARMRRELPLQKMRLLHKMGDERKAAGGIEVRGLGISRIELFESAVSKQVATVEKKLARIRSRRELQRKLRISDKNSLSISVLGYTCAGKSTLVNALTQSLKPMATGSSMFTTLSPQTRRASFSGLPCLITDTVGFIEDLPEILRESFLSTLEEGIAGDILLVCADASEPRQEIIRKLETVLSYIDAIGKESSPRIVVLTKKDIRLNMSPEDVTINFHLPSVAVSAIESDIKGLNSAIKAIRAPFRWQIEIEESAGLFSLRSFLFDEFAVISESFENLKYYATFDSWENALSLKKKAHSLGLSFKIRLAGNSNHLVAKNQSSEK
ncbi:MAG: GTPase HflX [Candidatus Hodarchaeales archaeon]